MDADELHRHNSALTLSFVAACPSCFFFSLPRSHTVFPIVTVSGGYRVSRPMSMPTLTAHGRCSLPHPCRHEACVLTLQSPASTVLTTAVVLGFLNLFPSSLLTYHFRRREKISPISSSGVLLMPPAACA